MEIKAYYCPDFINENSPIYRIKSIERDKDGFAKNIEYHPDSQTMLSQLYRDGYRLIQSIKLNQSAHQFQFMFFLERE